mgnify:FL=1
MKILNGFKKLVKKGVAAVKNCISAIKSGVRSCVSAICGALTRVKAAACPVAGEGYVDTGVKIIISVVIGGLLLAGLYTLFNSTILPTLGTKISEMFSYTGA